ncbi:hypothetical protein [uncultured Dokdonia sp.]|uniref:hypothetical protein n=1 Tax=uncultured Dokdonia sp. TaxID=575653 RepID=UPI002618309C|nr:hypothetical protein [uncultured Dokdonia sp.]
MTVFKKSISNKLKGIFGDSLSEEDRMTQHFINHSNSLVRKSHHHGMVSLQILQRSEELSAILYKGNNQIKTISLDEIPLFFTNGFTASFIGKSLVEQKLKNYFKSLEVVSCSKTMRIQMVIDEKEKVRIYTCGTIGVNEVSLSEFITFFKS